MRLLDIANYIPKAKPSLILNWRERNVENIRHKIVYLCYDLLPFSKFEERKSFNRHLIQPFLRLKFSYSNLQSNGKKKKIDR